MHAIMHSGIGLWQGLHELKSGLGSEANASSVLSDRDWLRVGCELFERSVRPGQA
ncbi:hypothetical protein GCM10010969_05830 [Saccharibacillus kuerlensis]|uniref:Uncharacterized protein n=1 Tax=Saccharibacillus kuerlensis TaxID=459527 RepID=A0ABQ2KVF1_9BACL|nr:hypothetical protein GCM10010969_05830 [Saccharibacillus kuerlensis]